MNDCITARSSARVGRRDAVAPSRRMTGPDSGFPDTGGGWNNGRICVMLSDSFDRLQSMPRNIEGQPGEAGYVFLVRGAKS